MAIYRKNFRLLTQGKLAHRLEWHHVFGQNGMSAVDAPERVRLLEYGVLLLQEVGGNGCHRTDP